MRYDGDKASTGRKGNIRVTMSARFLILASAATAMAAGPREVQAQSMRGSVEQIGVQQPVGIQQVAGRSADPASTSPQVASAAESASPARQLTSERGAGPGAVQLSKGPRSAQGSAALSSRADGRTSAVERVSGSDRCDPAARRGRSEKCAAVIESRSAEFARREAPTLSPEQRIIVDQQLRDRLPGVGEAARRLAASGDDAQSMEAQSVASVVLAPPPPGPEAGLPKDDPTATPQMQAIINAIVGRAGPP